MKKHKAIVAIDFDHTIAYVDFPKILGLKEGAKEVINSWYDDGIYIVINTCRSGEHETQAVEFLRGNGIKFHLINENHIGLIKFFGGDSRKISCDFYLDDKNIEQAVELTLNKNNLDCHYKTLWYEYDIKLRYCINSNKFNSILNVVV